MASPGSQARGFHDSGRLGRSSRSNSTSGGGNLLSGFNRGAVEGVGQAQKYAPYSSGSFTSGGPGTQVGRETAPTKAGGLGTARGTGKPGEDLMSNAQAAIPNKPLSDVEKALLEARRQRRQQETGLDIAQTVLGALPTPAPMGALFGLGRYMGKKAEDAAAANPDNFTGNPATGEVKSKSGPLTSNRAQDLPSNKANMTNAGGEVNAETVKKKRQALPTLLGAPAQALGTYSNPIMIT